MGRLNNDTDLLLRVRRDEKIRVKNDTDLLLRVRQDTKSRVKNYADLLRRVRQEEKSDEIRRHVAKGKMRSEE